MIDISPTEHDDIAEHNPRVRAWMLSLISSFQATVFSPFKGDAPHPKSCQKALAAGGFWQPFLT